MVQARLRDIVEQLQELKSLRGKNQSVVEHMMRRIDIEKKEFDASLVKLAGTRAVFARLSTELYTTLGVDIVQREIDNVRVAMEKSRFSTGLRDAVKVFFSQLRDHLALSEAKIVEINAMMEGMYRKFSSEHALSLNMPMAFSLDRYYQDLQAIEAVYAKQFGTATLLTTSRVVLMERFFDSIASRVRKSARAANADAEVWLKVIMAPLETQIRQHKGQLKHRLSSVSRIHDATDSLEQKIALFETTYTELEQRKSELSRMAGLVVVAMKSELAPLEAAA